MPSYNLAVINLALLLGITKTILVGVYRMLELLFEKFKESFLSVVPIIAIVLVLNYTIAPLPFWSLVLFLISAFVMVLGIALLILALIFRWFLLGNILVLQLLKVEIY